jgi:hypothetical protein
LIDAYIEAIKSGLTSLNGAADKVLTAAFSLATALAAVIGLVSAKDQPGPIAIALPFVIFGLAALAAMTDDRGDRGRAQVEEDIRDWICCPHGRWDRDRRGSPC